MNTHFMGDLIRDLKSHTGHIFRQFVRILLNDPIHIQLIGLINLHSQCQGNSVILQKNHGLTEFSFFLRLLCDLLRFPFTDAFNLYKTLRLFFNDTEGIFLKSAHNTGCNCRPDTFDRPGAQIPLNGSCILRGLNCISIYFKLRTVRRMHRIFSGCLHAFSFADDLKHAHTGDLILILGKQIQNRITILFISIYNMLYKPGNRLHSSPLL